MASVLGWRGAGCGEGDTMLMGEEDALFMRGEETRERVVQYV